MSSAFPLRGVEMHGDRMWSWRWVKRTIDLAAEHGLNALVFHRNDMLDMLAFPSAYFSVEEIWARWPVRYHNIDNNRQYFRQVMTYAGEHGIATYLEVKEISFHDSILHKHPALWTGRGVCPSDPFWWSFVEVKVEEVLAALPDLAGVIVSPATRETRVTISANECDCPRCRATQRVDWYEHLIGAMFRPLDRHGRTLAVRDFSYTRGNQGAVLEAAGRVSARIAISLKNTPHDYYPTFPNNPRIGDVGPHRQWVEFDTWGQFFGLGLFPCIVLEDMRARFAHCRDNRVEGVIARTDWEVISDGSIFDTLNLANLTGFARLAAGEQTTTRDLIQAQLRAPISTSLGGGLDEALFTVPDDPAVISELADVLEASWQVTAKSIFVLRHVFHEDCMFPDTLRKAWMMLTEVHGLADWEPESEGALELSPAKLQEIFVEKDEALDTVRRLALKLEHVAAGLAPNGRDQLLATARLWVCYVEGFRACARACFTAAYHRQFATAETAGAARRELDALDHFRRDLETTLGEAQPSYLVRWMLDVRRLEHLSTDLHELLGPTP